MKVYIIGESAFVSLGGGYLLCIGTATEVDGKSEREIRGMISEALGSKTGETYVMAPGPKRPQ